MARWEEGPEGPPVLVDPRVSCRQFLVLRIALRRGPPLHFGTVQDSDGWGLGLHEAPPPAGGELYFLLGRHFYRQGDFEQAVSLFQSVKREDPFFVKAKFFEGVTYVRQYKGKPAVEAFKDILVIAEERPGHQHQPHRHPRLGQQPQPQIPAHLPRRPRYRRA